MASHNNPRTPSPVHLENGGRKIRRDSGTSATNTPENVPLVTINDEPPLAKSEIDDFNNDGDKNDTNGIPTITSRAGPDGGSDNPDEHHDNEKPTNTLHPARFPYTPSIGRDIENGSILPDLESIPDVNVYQHKKTLAQGMMDLALFSANANQLRYVLESFERHPYYYPSVVLISISLICQIAVGVGLIWNATYNVKDEKEICIANKISNFTIIGIFFVTVVNVFISAFGVAGPPSVAVATIGAG